MTLSFQSWIITIKIIITEIRKSEGETNLRGKVMCLALDHVCLR